MTLQVILAKSNKNIFRDGDDEFDYNRRYHHFGVYDPVGLVPARPDKLLSRWLKLVKYCAVQGFTPVAIFGVDNPSLSRMCRRLGMLTVGTARDCNPEHYTKVVMDENLFLDVNGIYYFEIPNTEMDRPAIIQKAEEKEIEIFVVAAASASDRPYDEVRTVNPGKVLRDQPRTPDRTATDPYAGFPIEDLMEQFVTRTDDQSLPLEMPEGLHDFTKL